MTERPIMRERLVQVLNAVDKPTEFYKSPDGSMALVMPYGGRVLGLFAPQGEENFFWTHSALVSLESARAFYESAGWHNSGGDRTWLAPEVDFFFPDFPSTDKYWQQRELDPGNYQVARTGNTLSLRVSGLQRKSKVDGRKGCHPNIVCDELCRPSG